MADIIQRISSVSATNLVFTNSASTSASIALAQKAGALLHCVSTSTNAAVVLRFLSMPDEKEGTKYLLCDSANAPVEITISATRSYAIPDQLFAALKVVPLVTTSATATCRMSYKT